MRIAACSLTIGLALSPALSASAAPSAGGTAPAPVNSAAIEGEIKTLTDAKFTADVLQSATPVLVLFWITDVPACRQVMPYIQSVAKAYAGKLVVGRLDVNGNLKTPTQYDVRSVPTLLLFHHGKVINKLVGVAPKLKIETFVKDSLVKAATQK